MKILLTGGAGFIGSHVAEQLIAEKYEVVIMDSFSTSSATYLPEGVRLYQVDINDPAAENVFKIEKPAIIIHLAAQTSVAHSMRDPYFDFQTNTAATVKLLQYAVKYGVRQFVFASSAAVYGEPVHLPVVEEHPISPQSFYAVSKYTAERYIQAFAQIHRFTYTILRFSNVYGPRQNTSGEAGVVGIFILRQLKKECCTIYGGHQTRDFIYVKDVASACKKAVELNKQGIFNISSNIEISIEDLNELIAKKMDADIHASYKPFRKGELIRSVLSNEYSQQKLAWEPAYSLTEGLDETIEHYVHRSFHRL